MSFVVEELSLIQPADAPIPCEISGLAGLISVVVVALAASLLYRHEVQSLVMDGTQELRFGVLPDPSSPARAPLETAFLEAYGVAMLIAAALAGFAAVAGAVLIRPKT